MENYSIPHIRKKLLDSGDASLVHLCRELDDDKLRMVLDIVRDVTREQAEAKLAAEEVVFADDREKALADRERDLLFARSEGYGG